MPLPIPQDINELKAFFITGATPTQEQFYAWLETMFHHVDGLNARMIAAEAAAAAAAANAAKALPKVRGRIYWTNATTVAVFDDGKTGISSVVRETGIGSGRIGVKVNFTTDRFEDGFYVPFFSANNYPMSGSADLSWPRIATKNEDYVIIHLPLPTTYPVAFDLMIFETR